MTTTFLELGVPAPLADILARDGKTTAFPIQVDTLPDTLAGRDVLGRGRTGSGKTLAFSLPIVARLAGGRTDGRGDRRGDARTQPGRPRALVLAPTRELATQIEAVILPLAGAYGLRTTTVFGGVSQRRQEQALARGVDIMVACPGRLEDLMRQRIVSLDAVEITVLDEADHMADLGFLPGVTRIMSATPAGGQRLLFSATLDNGVDRIVKRFLSDPVRHSVDPAEGAVTAMTHHVFHLTGADHKRDVVETLASGAGRRILFMRTKHHAKRLAKQLTAAGIPAVDLHGNLSQNARDRNLAVFAAGEARVLVATDVAARGVHVDGIELVVHVDPPVEHKAYLHRSGRTARAGEAGDVVTLVLPEQRRDTQQLLRKANITVTPIDVSAHSAPVDALVGEVAPRVTPSASAVAAASGGDRGPRGGGRGRSGQGARSGQGGRSSQGGRPGEADAQGRRRSGGPSRGGQGGSGQGGNGHGGNGHSGGQGGGQRSGGQRPEGGQGASRGQRSAGRAHSSAADFSAGARGGRRRG